MMGYLNMKAEMINPFLNAAIHVLRTMASVEAKPGKPFLKNDKKATGDITGIIGITGQISGSLSITFTLSCIEQIVGSMFGEEVHGMTDEIRDAVGELTNMISGDARNKLSELGINLKAALPTVISGMGHVVKHINAGPCIAIPFETLHGSFVVEVNFEG